VQFTIGKEGHDKLRRVQTLLRREIPDGDPGTIFDRALTLLLEKVEKTKMGAVAKPRSSRSIRPGTDRQVRTPILPSRYTPRGVKRAVARRDRDQCAFVSKDGQRCTERTFLEFHHIQTYAHGGPATVENKLRERSRIPPLRAGPDSPGPGPRPSSARARRGSRSAER
jgi:hypothetical protein